MLLLLVGAVFTLFVPPPIEQGPRTAWWCCLVVALMMRPGGVAGSARFLRITSRALRNPSILSSADAPAGVRIDPHSEPESRTNTPKSGGGEDLIDDGEYLSPPVGVGILDGGGGGEGRCCGGRTWRGAGRSGRARFDSASDSSSRAFASAISLGLSAIN